MNQSWHESVETVLLKELCNAEKKIGLDNEKKGYRHKPEAFVEYEKIKIIKNL